MLENHTDPNGQKQDSYSGRPDGIDIDEVNILHLSDLHFGIEKDHTKNGSQRKFRQKEMLKKLIATLMDDTCVPQDWKPDVVVISGDIAWSGALEEYQEFEKEFIAPLKSALHIADERIITCPGNHDIIREKAEGFERPYRNQQELQIKNISRESIEKKRKDHFENYVKVLCAGDPQNLCRSVTLKEWPWVRFLVMNSAWDSRDDHDEGTLRVGLDLLEEIAGEEKEGEIIVSVFHHPHTEVTDRNIQSGARTKRNWLHLSEREPSQEGGNCFCSVLEQRSNYILNGHIHQETSPRHSQEAKSIQLISGTAYSTDTPKYHCRILKLCYEKGATYRDMRCTLGGGNFSWEVTMPKDFRKFGLIQTSVKIIKEGKKEYEAMIAQAIAIIESEENEKKALEQIKQLMQAVTSSSEMENKMESKDNSANEKGHFRETNPELLLKGP